MRHLQALDTYGEYSLFVLMWHPEDHAAGLVERCTNCFVAYGRVAEAFGQPSQHLCESCFGTTFEGGVKARVVSQAMWDTTGEAHTLGGRGEAVTRAASIQAGGDFVLRTGDYAFRGDLTRWYVRGPAPARIVTGFGVKAEGRNVVGYNYASANLEDRSSVAYIIPPTDSELELLLSTHGRFPSNSVVP